MTRRLFAASGLAAGLAAADAPIALRGVLRQQEGQPAALELPGGKVVRMKGDSDTVGVLNDARLKDADFEIHGSYLGSGEFEIEPIHKRALFVYKDSKRLYVTYWCEVCAIRTYTPGTCWCCQEETALDLKDKLDAD